MNVIIWGVLAVLVIYDAREHRIPNNWLKVLLVSILIQLTLIYGSFFEIHYSHWLGMIVGFSVCFVLYLLRAMAAGDVKLIALICLMLGSQLIWQYFVALTLTGGFFACFYLALVVASERGELKTLLHNYISINVYGRLTRSGLKPLRLDMPFAPAIVTSLLFLPYLS